MLGRRAAARARNDCRHTDTRRQQKKDLEPTFFNMT
jgi:hypothetical protein